MNTTPLLKNYPASMQPLGRVKSIDSWIPQCLADAADPESWVPLRQPSAPGATGPTAKPTQTAYSGSAKPTRSFAAHESHQPAAGASGGRAPLPATYFPARYLHITSEELAALLNQLRDPLCTHLYFLIEGHSVFDTGEFLGSYAALMELCTPPQPERGKRRLGPTMRVLRRAVDDLEQIGLLQRGERNCAQGQLRLFITKLQSKNSVTPTRKEGRV